MVIEPNVTLFVDDNENPDYYWAQVEISSGYEIVSYGDIEEDSIENTFHVDVEISPFVSGQQTIEILFGDLDAESTEKFIHIHLVDSTEVASGEGVKSTEEAQQETRPIDLNNLPD